MYIWLRFWHLLVYAFSEIGFAKIFAFCKNFVIEIITCLYCFSSKIIKKIAIDKYCIFYNNNNFPSFFGKSVFLMHI